MATLTSTIIESVSLNGAVRGTTNTVSIANITQVEEKIISCPFQTTRIAAFEDEITNVGAGIVYPSMNNALVNYIRVTNLDDTLNIQVAFVTTGNNLCSEEAGAADSYRVLLKPAQSHILWETKNGKLGEGTVPDYEDVLSTLQYIEVNNYTEGEDAHDINVGLFVAAEES